MDILFLNGVAVEPSSLDIERLKLWSEGSGRATNGDWTGDIKARKWKLSCTVKGLSKTEAAKILNAIDGDEVQYFNVKFINPYSTTGNWATATCYSSDTKISVYNYTRKNITYSSVTFSTVGK